MCRHVHGGHVVRLGHDLRHALSVVLGVQMRFREQGGVFLVRNPELIVESVVPDVLHVIPIRDDAVLNGILQDFWAAETFGAHYPSLRWQSLRRDAGKHLARPQPSP